MRDKFKPTTDENPMMIVLGILVFYLLIAGFIFYLYVLHRITIIPCIISILIFTGIYLPRFGIIKKIQNKDEIKILDDSILINGRPVPFFEIKDFRTEEKKSQVVFFMNNKMVIFAECKFYLRLPSGQIEFSAIGTEKIKLLKEFLNNIIN
ncbi:MAG: hypothetical protein K2F57_04350 [Candidatus Gastranaerophilales bacterium]|nr:hypothetical protein [Candidatus Gastranaerophilales bacterium]